MNKYKTKKKKAFELIKKQIAKFEESIIGIKQHSINNKKDYLAKKKLTVFLKRRKRLALYLRRCVKEFDYQDSLKINFDI